MKHELPDLIPYDAIQGDLQMHTKWSDGQRTIEEMAQAAKTLGYSYIAITDHYSTMPIVNGLNEQRLRRANEGNRPRKPTVRRSYSSQRR